MKHKFKYLEPSLIMTIVVSLIILGVGAYAVLTVTSTTRNDNSLRNSGTSPANTNVTTTWFNIGLGQTVTSLSGVLQNSTSYTVTSAYYTYNSTTGYLGVTNTGWY